MATKFGFVKKMNLIEFANVRKSGLIALKLGEGDELIGARLMQQGQELFLLSGKGNCIMFEEKQVRAMGRMARGVRGMRFRKKGDQVVAMVDSAEGTELLIVTSEGFGKRTSIAEYRAQGRGGKGLKTFRITDKSGDVVSAKAVRADDELIVVTREGIIIRLSSNQIPLGSRMRGGVRLIRLSDGDSVTGVAVLR
jgi:DNA gyrase subunit A